MTSDSTDHWQTARDLSALDWHAWRLNNAHPVACALVMLGFQSLGATSPWPLLFSTATLLALGAFAFVDAVSPGATARKRVRYSVLAVLLLPQVVLIAQIHWKDVWMCVALLFFASAFLRSGRRLDTSSAALLLVSAVLVALFRHNGIIFVVVALGVAQAVPAVGARRRMLWAGVLVGALGAPVALNRALGVFDAKLWRMSFVHDIAAVEKEDTFAHVREHGMLEALPPLGLVLNFEPLSAPAIFWATKSKLVPRLDDAGVSDRQLIALWWDAIASHPKAYVLHRLRMFGALAGLTSQWPAFTVSVWTNEAGIVFAPLLPWVAKAYGSVGAALHGVWFFVAGYAAVAAVLAGLYVRGRALVSLVLLAVVANQVSLMFVAPTPDVRYSWPTIVLTMLTLVAWREAALRQRTPGEADNPGHENPRPCFLRRMRYRPKPRHLGDRQPD